MGPVQIEKLNLQEGNKKENSRNRYFKLMNEAALAEIEFQERLYFDLLANLFEDQESTNHFNKTTDAPVRVIEGSVIHALLSDNNQQNLSLAARAFKALQESFNQMKDPEERELLISFTNALGAEGIAKARIDAEQQADQQIQAAQAKAAQAKAQAQAKAKASQELPKPSAPAADAVLSQTAKQQQPGASAPTADADKAGSDNSAQAQSTPKAKPQPRRAITRRDVVQSNFQKNITVSGLERFHCTEAVKHRLINAIKNGQALFLVFDAVVMKKSSYFEENHIIYIEDSNYESFYKNSHAFFPAPKGYEDRDVWNNEELVNDLPTTPSLG